ncbi:hypothetical protein V6N11_032256 [Hibiscus sabdariffa]|uniref:Uncharacterized protein n=1 Tax=Hibiscus sabdariffa TaxID=183260 RepID=A0ABR2T0V9_9ROSI
MVESDAIPLVPSVEQLWTDGRETMSSSIAPAVATQVGPSPPVQPTCAGNIDVPVSDGTRLAHATMGCSTTLGATRPVSPDVSMATSFREPTDLVGSSIAALSHDRTAASGSRVDTTIPHNPNVAHSSVRNDSDSAVVLFEPTADLVPISHLSLEYTNVVDPGSGSMQP